MRKQYFFIFISMLFFPLTAMGQGVDAGQTFFSLYGGLSAGLQRTGIEFAGEKDFAWGNFGGELGFSVQNFVNPYLSIGGDLRLSGFAGSDKEFFVWHGHHLDDYRVELDTSLMHLMAAGRLYLNPEGTTRLYIPFGAGLTLTNGEIKYIENDYYETSRDHTSASLGYYAGLGWEVDLGANYAFGIEGRYNSFTYDMGDLASKVGVDTTIGEKRYSYVSLALTFSFR